MRGKLITFQEYSQQIMDKAVARAEKGKPPTRRMRKAYHKLEEWARENHYKDRRKTGFLPEPHPMCRHTLTR